MATPTPPTPPSFSGSIPESYHHHFGPLLFEPCAADLVARLNLPLAGPLRILELACGTGILTSLLLKSLPADASLTATDLHEPMLDLARRHIGPDPRATFQQGDACNPPFPDASFDLILCQFGVMFFPDKPRAMREGRRILAAGDQRRGGRYVFSVWDSLDHNPMAAAVHETMARLFPVNPATFFSIPHGYCDRAEIERLLRTAGFSRITLETVTLPSTAPTAESAAAGFVDGSPLSSELRARGITDTTDIRRAVAQALSERFGRSPCHSTMREIVVSAA